MKKIRAHNILMHIGSVSQKKQCYIIVVSRKMYKGCKNQYIITNQRFDEI